MWGLARGSKLLRFAYEQDSESSDTCIEVGTWVLLLVAAFPNEARSFFRAVTGTVPIGALERASDSV